MNCLTQTENIMKKSIAFPCISTGEYKFPKRNAIIIAINAVKKWLNLHNNNIHVILNVYTDVDRKFWTEKIIQTKLIKYK